MNIIMKLMCLLSFLGEACVYVRAQQHLVTGNRLKYFNNLKRENYEYQSNTINQSL